MSDKDEPVGRSGTGTARAGAVATDKQVEARQACDVMEDGRVEQMAGTTRKKRSSQLQGSNIFVRLSHRLGAKKGTFAQAEEGEGVMSYFWECLYLCFLFVCDV